MAKTSVGGEPEEKVCRACTESLRKENFSSKQWMGSVQKQTRRCKNCVASGKEALPTAEPEAATTTAVNLVRKGKSKKKKKEVPTYAGNQKAGLYKPRNTSEVTLGLAYDICAWCGKAEEKNNLMTCGLCKNILYCSKRCLKAAWPEHELVCEHMKKDRKDSKEERKAMERAKDQGAFSLTEASGTGHFFYNCELIPGGKICMVSYNGELRGTQAGVYEEPGHHFASDASRDSIRRLLGPQGFLGLCRQMAKSCAEQRDSLRRTEFFQDVKELDEVDQFLLSCGPLGDIEHAKMVLPVVLHKISMSGLKPDGTIPNIGDIKVRGYGLNALEWSSRRGHYDIAKWLATDPRTRVMVSRHDSAPVAWACYTNKIKLAKMLVRNGADSHATTVNVFGHKPPTHLASENGQLLALKFLVEECGHNIHERDIQGQDIRASLRRNNKAWANTDGCVACDNYAKSEGVVGDAIRSDRQRRRNEASSNASREQHSLDHKLSAALHQLEIAGGREKEDPDGNDNPADYLNELLAVGDVRYELGQYAEAAGIYYRGYYVAMHNGRGMNNPAIYPIAHKMIQSWIRTGDESHLRMAHGMAQQNCMMPNHPPYAVGDLAEVEKLMKQKGLQIQRFF
mmetsp:Transcript_31590/g.74334  ORF Transcript_31590/g.74334 Transcript_31590/m.74334 type:complete len:624 (+) Transcript_31590:81-1952(+)